MNNTCAPVNEKKIEEYLKENMKSNLGIHFKVTLLSSGFWSSYKSHNLALSIEMVKCEE